MKTLSFTAGLLLVLLCIRCCDASPHAVKSGPEICCFKFFEKRIPKAQILSIEKTHVTCSKPAFVVETPRGDYCVRQTEQWAMGESVKHHVDERPIEKTTASPQQKPNAVVYIKQLSSTGFPGCVNPEGSRPESKWNNFNGSAVNPEQEESPDSLLCLLEMRGRLNEERSLRTG